MMETAVQVPSVHQNPSDSLVNRGCREEAGPSRLNRSNSVSHQRRSDDGNSGRGSSHYRLGKRRQSFGTNNDHKFKRRRPQPTLPTKFLLGGNIRDPLNLGSFQDEEISRIANAVTPKSSPLPTPKHRTQVDVVIPANINDPLNLNGGDDEAVEFSTLDPKNKARRKRKRKPRNKNKAAGTQQQNQDAPTTSTSTPTTINRPSTLGNTSKNANSSNSQNKIVSPVVPQGPRNHHHGRWNGRGGRFCRGGGRSWRGGSFRGGRYRSDSSGRIPHFVPDVENSEQQGANTSGFASCSNINNSDGWVASTSGEQVNPSSGQNNPVPNPEASSKKTEERFIYGNYNRYYGYRNGPAMSEDERIQFFQESWFAGKDLLDIGCNIGHLTLAIAARFHPRKTIGMDIDPKLINIAKKNVRHYMNAQIAGDTQFPVSLPICHGPIAGAALGPGGPAAFPNNVFFITGNYVLDSDEWLETQKPEYDVIICLSITKWIQLNWGDDGLKRFFRRMFIQLRPGGRLILEPQPIESYKKRKFTRTHKENFEKMKLFPDKYIEYLMSPEVGFVKCDSLREGPAEGAKGFNRPMYVLQKAEEVIECTPPTMECDTTTFLEIRPSPPPAGDRNHDDDSANQEPESTCCESETANESQERATSASSGDAENSRQTNQEPASEGVSEESANQSEGRSSSERIPDNLSPPGD